MVLPHPATLSAAICGVRIRSHSEVYCVLPGLIDPVWVWSHSLGVPGLLTKADGTRAFQKLPVSLPLVFHSAWPMSSGPPGRHPDLLRDETPPEDGMAQPLGSHSVLVMG
jgi:hypothetical protein